MKWGGAGGKQGVLYTASSDRTVRIWDAETVSLFTQNHIVYLYLIFLFWLGPTATYIEGACALGYNVNIKY